MSQIELYHYLALGAVLFALGMVGFLARRNLIMMFLATEIMFQGVAINLVAFSFFHKNVMGQAFVVFLLGIAAAEASLALGLVVYLYRKKATLNVDEWSEMQG